MDKFNLVLDVLEKHDPSVYKHSERVAMLCYQFGKNLGMDGKDVGNLYKAAFLHEIGKCDFSEEVMIQDKKFKLSEIYPILSKAVVYSLGEEKLAEVILQHLENADGSGNPNGIKEEDIHLFAIVIRICDFYDHCRMEGDTHSLAVSKIRKLTDIAFPKKMITMFIKMIVNDEELNFWNDVA
jgi:HD-GYP domain-containing protein (c-di-GMP phosphodiesterase class II)